MDLYFRQLLAGREFGRSDRFATQMANFVYLIGDRETRECVAVDPAWDLAGILGEVARDDMRLTGALVTHYHPDHIGGAMGTQIQGLAELMTRSPVKVYAHRAEVQGICQVSGLSSTDLSPVDSGQLLEVGGVKIQFIHTPGHTPGSQCFLVNGQRLVSGDTLFIGACGRVDLPGGDPEAMYESLTQKLAKLPDDVELFPGHDYGDTPSASMGNQKQTNPFLNASSLQHWLQRRGG